MTPQGHAALVEELKHLRTKERPEVVEVVAWAAGNGDRSENGDYIYGKKRLREIDRRIRFLMKRLDNAEVVDQAKQKGLQQVFFGATVTYETDEGEENTIQIVGVDEAKTEDGQVSWITPIAPCPSQVACWRRDQFENTSRHSGNRNRRYSVLTGGFNQTILEAQDTIHPTCQLEIVRSDQCAKPALFHQSLQQFEDTVCSLAVQVSGWLIGQ